MSYWKILTICVIHKLFTTCKNILLVYFTIHALHDHANQFWFKQFAHGTAPPHCYLLSYTLLTLSWHDRKCGSVAIHLAKTECNQRHVIFNGHECTTSCQVFMKIEFSRRVSLRLSHVYVVPNYSLQLFLCLSPFKLYCSYFLFAECLCSPGKRRKLRLKNWWNESWR